MQNQLQKIAQGGFRIVLYILAFFTPLLFSPTTFEFYEFNKQTLLFICVIMLLFFAGLQMLAVKSVKFYKSSINIPAIVFLVAILIATFLSISPLTSWIGYYGRLYGGTFSTLAFIFLFFLVSNTLDTHKEINRLLTIISISIGLLSLITILQRLQIYVFPNIGLLSFTHTPIFTTVGDYVTLPYTLILGLPLVISQVFNQERSSVWKLFFTTLGILTIIAFIFSALTITPWVILGIMFVAYSLLMYNHEDKQGKLLYAYLLIMTIACGILFNVFVAHTLKIFKPLSNSTFVQLPQADTWNIVGQTLATSPQAALFGSGPDTFFYDFIIHRPLSFDTSAYWQETFSLGSNQLFTILGNMGFVGLFTYLALLFFVLYYAYTFLHDLHKKEDGATFIVAASLTVAVIGYIASNFVVYASSTTTFFFWISIALLVALKNTYPYENVKHAYILSFIMKKGEEISTRTRDILYRVLFIGVLFLVCVALFFTGQNYIAETAFASAQYANAHSNISDEFNNSQQAVSMQPYKDYFNRSMAISAANALYALVRQNKTKLQDPTIQQEGKTLSAIAQNYASNAVALNVIDINNYTTAALVNQHIANIVTNAASYDQLAIAYMNTASRIDAINLDIKDTLANWLYENGDFTDAQNLFTTILNTRSDIAQFHYDYAQMLITEKNYDVQTNKTDSSNDATLVQQAIAQLQTVATLIGKQDASYKQVEGQIGQLEIPSVTSNTTKTNTTHVESKTPSPITYPTPTQRGTLNRQTTGVSGNKLQ